MKFKKYISFTLQNEEICINLEWRFFHLKIAETQTALELNENRYKSVLKFHATLRKHIYIYISLKLCWFYAV